MTSETAAADVLPAIEQAVMTGDLAELTTVQRAEYYNAVCRSLRLNPLTKPFEYLNLSGKLRGYPEIELAKTYDLLEHWRTPHEERSAPRCPRKSRPESRIPPI